jgi:putative FmdB family regulatory protein
MPLHEFSCEYCDSVEERFFHVSPTEEPPCPTCGGPRVRLASAFKVVFTGPLTARYNDPKKENAHMEGFWDYRVRSSTSGHPEAVFLDSWQALREFRKSESLSMPGDAPVNATMSADGRTISSAGMPGAWSGGMPSIPSRLQQIIDAPASDFKEASWVVRPSNEAPHGGVTGGAVSAEGMSL